MDCSTPGFSVLHHLLELAQAPVHCVCDAIQRSHSLPSTSPPAFNLFSIRVYSDEPALPIRWPKYWSFTFRISPSSEYSELISHRNYWLDLRPVQGTLESSLDWKEIQPVHPKRNQSWIFIGRTDVEAETPILWPPDTKSWLHWKRPWCRERLKAGGEGDNSRWDVWMASLTQWTWVWASSGSWWWTGKSGVQQSMGSQRVEHDWVTELNWRSLCTLLNLKIRKDTLDLREMKH